MDAYTVPSTRPTHNATSAGPKPPRLAHPMSRPVAVPPIYAIAHFHPAGLSLGAAWSTDSVGARCVQAQYVVCLLVFAAVLSVGFCHLFIVGLGSTNFLRGIFFFVCHPYRARSWSLAADQETQRRRRRYTSELDDWTGSRTAASALKDIAAAFFFLRRTSYGRALGSVGTQYQHQTDPTRTWGGEGGATLPSSRFLESLGEAPTHHPSSIPSHCTVQPTVPLLPPTKYQLSRARSWSESRSAPTEHRPPPFRLPPPVPPLQLPPTPSRPFSPFHPHPPRDDTSPNPPSFVVIESTKTRPLSSAVSQHQQRRLRLGPDPRFVLRVVVRLCSPFSRPGFSK